MALWKYYPQSPYVESATLTALTGTSSTLHCCLSYRAKNRCDVDTVSGSEFAFKIDAGMGIAITPDFVGFINHNLNAGECVLHVICGNAADNGTTWDFVAFDGEGGDIGGLPIDITELQYLKTKRYWKISISGITAPAYFGNFFMGVSRLPSVDCNYGSPILYDRSGVKTSETDGGSVFSIKRYGLKRIWNIAYEAISDADKAVLVGLESDCDGPHRPFIFTDTDSSLFYGRLNSQMQVTPTTAGLWDVSFQIREEITT